MKEGLADVDVVMMLRLQKERMDGGFIPSEREYYHRFGLDAEKLAHAKHDAIVMHPGPMNRGVEIDGTLADDINRSVIQEQVEMGVAVRMAAMDLLARNLRAERAAARARGHGMTCAAAPLPCFISGQIPSGGARGRAGSTTRSATHHR